MDRTVGNNRLIDGLKLDALSLNGSNKINTQSLADGSVTDEELKQLNTLHQDLVNAATGQAPLGPSTPKTSTDNIVDNVIVTYDIPNNIVTFTNLDGSYTRYSTNGYIDYLVDGSIKQIYSATGTWSTFMTTDTVPVTAYKITYTNGVVINSDGHGTISIGAGTYAYTNFKNVFTVAQEFKKEVKFGATIVGNYTDSTVYSGSGLKDIVLDGRLGNEFKIVLNKNTNLYLDYLYEGTPYSIHIVKNGFSVKLVGLKKILVSSTGVISSTPMVDGTYWEGSGIPANLTDGVTTPVVTITGLTATTAFHCTSMGTKGVAYPTIY